MLKIPALLFARNTHGGGKAYNVSGSGAFKRRGARPHCYAGGVYVVGNYDFLQGRPYRGFWLNFNPDLYKIEREIVERVVLPEK